MLVKLTNADKRTQITAYSAFLAVIWGFIFLLQQVENHFGLYSQEWITSWQRNGLFYLSLAIATLVANRIGGVSYLGVALVALFGVTGVVTVLFFREAVFADSFSFGPWYGYFAVSAVACIVLFIGRHLTSRSSVPLRGRTR